MSKIVTFGEVMMRLAPPGHAKFSQASNLELTFGGGEANVAISLAYFGDQATHVTRFPNNSIGKAATQFLRYHWVDTDEVIYGEEEIGLYFLERGAVHRSSKVVYNRFNSAFATMQPEMLDWDQIFMDADWFHWTGITPGISQNVADTCLEAIKAAKRNGVMVSSDMTYRKNLWQYGKKPGEVMGEMIANCDIVITGANDISEIFGFPVQGKPRDEEFAFQAQKLMERYPDIKKVADKERNSLNASHNTLKGRMWDGEQLLLTEMLDVTHIIDRVGTGDAYAAGLIYGLLHHENDQHALEFAIAACALKHTIEGDANMVSVADVEGLVGGNTSGAIIR